MVPMNAKVVYLDDEWQHCELPCFGIQLPGPSQLHQPCQVDIVVDVEVWHRARCCHGADHGAPVAPAHDED